MGCWNHTCAVTNLPIRYGEDVYVMLLIEKNYAASYCYPTVEWEPIPAYFEGKYDDYGAVEDCSGVLLPLLVDTIKQHLVEMELGQNKYHDIAVKKDQFDLKLLFEADHERRLFISNRIPLSDSKQQLRVKHIVIRKQVFEDIMSQYTFKRYDGGTTTVNDLINSALELCDEYKKVLQQSDGEEKSRITSRTLMFGRIRDGNNNMFCRFADDGDLFNRSHFWAVSVVMDAVEQGQDYVEVATNICKAIWLCVVYNNGRRVWGAPSGAGSQDDSTTVQRMLAQITLDRANDVDHYYDE